jgi:WD40 repeat protein
MDHPNIAKVLDAGATDTGRPFFVMELVRGIKITDYCDQHRLAARERLGLFIQVCQAVQHAHQKGIIHRDLKPSNILVTLHDGVPVPKVIDFGIAKATTGQRLTDKTLFTAFEQFMGTPAYMSPEQAEMSGLDIDTRSDIYSLGVLLYEMLTGSTPFDARELMASGLDAMRKTIREKEPPRPSTRLAHTLSASCQGSPAAHAQIANLKSKIEDDLDWIVMKCLEKDRTRRYETANGLAADLKRHLANEPVVARPPSTVYRLQKAFRRNKLAFSAGLAVAAALLLTLVALAVSMLLVTREQRATQAALQAESLSSAELQRTLGRERVDSYFHRITLAYRELSGDNLAGALNYLNDCPEDLRGWEWHYLMRLGRVEPVVLRDTSPVHGVAFHPEGRRVAAACGDGTVKVWDLASGKVVQTLRGHSQYVFCVTFRPPEGRFLASASADRTVRLWDLNTDEVVFQIAGVPGEQTGMSAALAFSPDGKHLLTPGDDGAVIVRDATDGSEIHRLDAKHEFAATCLAWSPDGRFLATGSWGGVLRIWDALTYEILRTPPENFARVGAVKFSRDSQLLATAGFDRMLRLWNPASGQESRTWRGHVGIIPGMDFSPASDSPRLASCGGEDRAVKLWDPRTGREILALRGHTSRCHSAAFSPDGQQLVSAGSDGTIRVWDATPLKPTETQEALTVQHDHEVWSVAFSPDGRLLASGGWDKTARLWDAQTGKPVRTLDHSELVFRIAFDPEGRRLAVSTFTGERGAIVTLWDILTGQKESVILEEKGMPFFVTFDPTGRYLLREGPNFTVKVWDLPGQADAGTLGQHDWNIWSTVFSPDGNRLATGSNDGRIKVWSWNPSQLSASEEPELTLSGLVQGYGQRVVFSPDGRRLIAGGEMNTVKIWDAQTGQPLQALSAHTGEVWAVATDRQNRWLASAGEDSTIRIWDATSGQLLRTLRGHTGVIMSLGFSPDGRRLASGSRDHTVKFWDTARWSEPAGR